MGTKDTNIDIDTSTNADTDLNTDTNKYSDTAIAYQNKDIISKFFGNRMKGKPLSLFGLKSDLKVVDARPTNIPIVQVKELRMDNLFELEDGSVAIIDYESESEEENFTKYGRYIMEVIDRYRRERKRPDIHMIVLYTADIGHGKTTMERTACSIRAEVSYLTGTPSEEWLKDVRKRITENTVTDETLMHLVLLPLTYKGNSRKQEAIIECANLARMIPDKEQESFALAGILAFTDKIIDEATKQQIKEVLGMTQVGKMLMDEAREEARTEEREKNARNMLKRGKLTIEEIAEDSGLSVARVKQLAEMKTA